MAIQPEENKIKSIIVRDVYGNLTNPVWLSARSQDITYSNTGEAYPNSIDAILKKLTDRIESLTGSLNTGYLIFEQCI